MCGVNRFSSKNKSYKCVADPNPSFNANNIINGNNDALETIYSDNIWPSSALKMMKGVNYEQNKNFWHTN